MLAALREQRGGHRQRRRRWEGGARDRGHARGRPPAGDTGASVAEPAGRSGRCSLHWVQRHVPGPQPRRRQTPGGQDTAFLGRQRPTREARKAGRRRRKWGARLTPKGPAPSSSLEPRARPAWLVPPESLRPAGLFTHLDRLLACARACSLHKDGFHVGPESRLLLGTCGTKKRRGWGRGRCPQDRARAGAEGPSAPPEEDRRCQTGTPRAPREEPRGRSGSQPPPHVSRKRRRSHPAGREQDRSDRVFFSEKQT